ncbi:hypothetical protein ACFL2H_05360 [Planctomycetota bacterium]
MLWFVLIVYWIGCGFVGCTIASRRMEGEKGFWMGFFFGPVGVFGAAFLDNRPQCPRCGGRLNEGFEICQNCATTIDWSHGRPLTPEMLKDIWRPEE